MPGNDSVAPVLPDRPAAAPHVASVGLSGPGPGASEPVPPARPPTGRRSTWATTTLVVTLFALAIGAIIAVAITTQQAEDAVTVPVSASPASASSAPPAATPPPVASPPSVTSPPSTPGPVTIGSLRTAVLVVPTLDIEQIDACRSEERQLFASLQAYINQTGAWPRHPDPLVDSGWLPAHPDGWSSAWAIEGRGDGYLYIVPVSGGRCDL